MINFIHDNTTHLNNRKTQIINTKIETLSDLEGKVETNNSIIIKTYIDEIKQFLKNPEYELNPSDITDPDYYLFIKQTKLIYAQKALLLSKQYLYKPEETFFNSYISSLDIKKDIETDKHHLKTQMLPQTNFIDAIDNDIDIIFDASVWMRRFSALAFGALLVISGLFIYKKYKK